MMGTVCRGPSGGHRRGSTVRRRRLASEQSDSAAAMAAALRPAFADPLVATTEALVRADAGGFIMTDDTRDHDDFWYRGQTTRRRVLGYGASAARSARPCWCRRRGRRPSARPSPTRSARCSRSRARVPPAARPHWLDCRWRSTASTRTGGINGRPVEIVVADDKSKPDVGRRKTEKMLEEDKVDAHVGGDIDELAADGLFDVDGAVVAGSAAPSSARSPTRR